MRNDDCSGYAYEEQVLDTEAIVDWKQRGIYGTAWVSRLGITR